MVAGNKKHALVLKDRKEVKWGLRMIGCGVNWKRYWIGNSEGNTRKGKG